MACGCKKNSAAKTVTTSAPVSTPVVKSTTNVTESKPQKKIGNRIIKREIR